MKWIFFSLCFCLSFSDQSQAQTDLPNVKLKKINSKEIGVTLYRVKIPLPNYYMLPYYQPRFYFLPGFYYRYFHGNNGFRFAASYLKHETDVPGHFVYKDEPHERAEVIGPLVYQGVELQVGYQYRFTQKKFTVYILGDFTYTHAREWRQAHVLRYGHNVYIDGSFCGDGSYPSNLDSHSNSFGFSSGLGLRYKASEHLFTSFESKAQYSFVYIKGGGYAQEQVALIPVQISVGYTW